MHRLLTTVATSLVFGAFAQDFSKVEIKAEKLTANIYMLTGAGGNIGLSIGDDAGFIVDNQFAPLTGKIEAAIARLTDKPLRFVINTHWHYDHTGGNENLGRKGVVIVAHDNVRRRMSKEQFIEFLRNKVPAAPSAAQPVMTFMSDISLHLNGEEVRAFHPGTAHTDGDVIVHYRKSDVIHMGDLFFNGMYPFIDVSSGGRAEGVVSAVDQVLAIAGDGTRIIPGHRPLASKADLKAYREMLATMIGRVKEAIASGKKLEEIVAAKPTADFDGKWGGGFIKADKFVEMLWGLLK
jgi:glyoxylase-like metal-dependent hydrolase (beta-lactamase superfamily II)